MDTLQNSFKGYFGSGDLKVETWIRNPFLADIDCISDEDLAKDDLIDLRTKEMLQNEFNSKSLGEFWCALTQAYPRLAKRAMSALILFATTYLCESGYSALVSIKTKIRNRLDVKDDMRVTLSKTTPQFHILIYSKQQQPSH